MHKIKTYIKPMKTLFKLYTLIFFISPFFSLNAGSSFELPEGLKTAFHTGNAKDLAKYFNASIELEVLGKDGVYSKTQAEQIMKDFFAKHPPKSFSVLFEGGKEYSQYAIGKLITTSGSFRINFLVKGQIILQLRIEEDDVN
jgi:hypothetical protein